MTTNELETSTNIKNISASRQLHSVFTQHKPSLQSETAQILEAANKLIGKDMTKDKIAEVLATLPDKTKYHGILKPKDEDLTSNNAIVIFEKNNRLIVCHPFDSADGQYSVRILNAARNKGEWATTGQESTTINAKLVEDNLSAVVSIKKDGNIKDITYKLAEVKK